MTIIEFFFLYINDFDMNIVDKMLYVNRVYIEACFMSSSCDFIAGVIVPNAV
jgi:hypothetical protein